MSNSIMEAWVEKAEAIQKDVTEISNRLKADYSNKEIVDHLNKRLDAVQAVVQGIEPIIQSAVRSIEDSRADLLALQKVISALPGQVSIPRNTLEGLTRELMNHSQLLTIPQEQRVRHHHYITRPILIGIGLVMLVLTLIGVLADLLVRH